MGKKVLAMLIGDTNSFEVVFMLVVLVILKGGVKQKVAPCLEGGGGGHKKFRTCNFPNL